VELMLSESTAQQLQTLSAEERERLRHQITEACEPIAPFWPMKSFVHHNPLHGLEHLSFDRAIREAKRLLGGSGYLSNREYRQLYREGRITDAGVRRALQRVGPRIHTQTLVQVGLRQIGPPDVLRLHLLFGFEALEAALLTWTFGAGGATKRFQHDLPAGSKLRILERTRRECESPRRNSEESYLTNLWDSTLSALRLPVPFFPDSQDQGRGEGESQRSTAAQPARDVALPTQRTVGDWLESLAGASIVDQINEQMIKWTAAFVDEGMAGWPMPSRSGGFYQAWRELAQRDLSGRFLGIKDLAQRVRDLPGSPEDAIALGLNRLGVPEEQWMEYLSRHLAQLPGWAGFIRWLGENPEYPGQKGHPIDPAQYLAVRLFYEAELADTLCRREWGIPGTLSALVSYWQNHLDEYQHLIAPDLDSVDRQTQAICHRAWRLFRLAQFLEMTPVEVQELPSSSIQTLLGWLDAFPEDKHGPVWLEAYEDRYREQLIDQLSAHRGKGAGTEARPRAQLVFCIDVRSEPFRRHVETQGPYETLGFAGFFGVPISHQAFDSEERVPLCPVLLKPKHAVHETPRPGQDKPLQSYASGTRWRQLGHHMFHDLKHNPIGSFMLIDVLGFLFSAGLIGKTLIPRPYETIKEWIRRRFTHSVATQIPVNNLHRDQNRSVPHSEGTENPLHGLALGFAPSEQTTFVENGLRTMGLTKNFGRFVVLCGHGSVSDNNPYFGALHCGACGGKHGDPNARVFAAMGNNPEVRRLLKERGLAIPDDTRFLGGKHITTTDRVALYDIEDVPATHRDDLRVMINDLEKAGAHQALERCRRIPRAPRGLSPDGAYRHVVIRTVDWANVRPEWGLSGNAAFLIGRRNLTKDLDLGGRVFLHSYDPEPDTEGGVLEKILMAPLIVGEWISMEHYFSGVDPWFWGSGSKVIHNVVSSIGVMLGSQSDLQTGLPLQTVNDGAIHYHEPMRLLTIIEAPVRRISPIIQKHTALQHLFHNQWVNLIAVDPTTFQFQRYNPDSTWEAVPMTGVDLLC
jgi:uncharacterized protein